MSDESKENSGVTPISLQNLEFVVPETLINVISLIDRGTSLNFSSSAKRAAKQTAISVDKDLNGNVKFSVKSGNFQILENGLTLKCVIRDITKTGGGTRNKDKEGSIGLINVPRERDCHSAKDTIDVETENPEQEASQEHSVLSVSDNKYESFGRTTSASEPPSKKQNVLKTSDSDDPQELNFHPELNLSNEESLEVSSEKISDLSFGFKVDPEMQIASTCVGKEAEPAFSCHECPKRFKRRKLLVGHYGRCHPRTREQVPDSISQMYASPGSTPIGTRVSPRQVARAEKEQKLESSLDNSQSLSSSEPGIQAGDQSLGEVDDSLAMDDSKDDSLNIAAMKPGVTNSPPDYSHEKNIQCRLCKSWVKNYVVLYEHIQRLHANHEERDSYIEEVKNLKKVSCDLCNKVLSQESELKNHLENAHGPSASKEPKIEFSCHECPKAFRDRKHLRAHFERCHPRTRLLCHLCPSSFKTKIYLQEHIDAVHEKKIAYECSVCGKTFIARSTWTRHKRKHENKMYSCPHCDREFFEKQNLARHVRVIHELGRATKQLSCEHCKKCYTNHGNLKQHIKTVHLNEYDNVCSTCGKGFLRKKALKEHVETHHRILSESKTESLLQKTFPTATTAVKEENMSVRCEIIDPLCPGNVAQNSDDTLQSVYIFIQQEESGSAVSQLEQSELSNIEFIHPSTEPGAEITIGQSSSEQLSANYQLQQILDLAQLEANSNQQIHIQDVTEELAGVLHDHGH